MFDWSINEARRDKIAREIQRAIAKAGARPGAGGVRLLYTPEVVEAMVGLLASLLEEAPQCVTEQGIDDTANLVGTELAQLIRDYRGLKTGAGH